MKKLLTKTMSMLLVVTMLFTAAPLAGFVGLKLPEFNLGKKANSVIEDRKSLQLIS